MCWSDLLAIIAAEAGPELAARIEARCAHELRGVRFSIPTIFKPTDAEIDAALRRHRYNVRAAAAELGISFVTIYRRMKRQRPQDVR